MHTSESETTYHFEGFLLDSSQRLLTRDGAAITLPPKAFDMLVVLIENRERVISKEELISTIWRDAFVSEDSLSQIIFILRRTLGDDPSTPRFIATSHRRGYRFIADVRVGTETHRDESTGDEAAAAPVPPMSLPSEPAPTQAHVMAERVRPSPLRGWVFVGAIVVSSAVSWVLGHLMLAQPSPVSAVRIRATQTLPAGASVSPGGALSPDAKWLAFVADD